MAKATRKRKMSSKERSAKEIQKEQRDAARDLLNDQDTPDIFQKLLEKISNESPSPNEASLDDSETEDEDSVVFLGTRETDTANVRGKRDQMNELGIEVQAVKEAENPIEEDDDDVNPLSKLDMEPQGLVDSEKPRDDDDDDDDDDSTIVRSDNQDLQISSNDFIQFQGVTFYKRRCYRSPDDKKIYAIKHFVSEEEAFIVSVYPFRETFVGTLPQSQEELKEASQASSKEISYEYVQVPQESTKVHLKYLLNLKEDKEISFPEWAISPKKKHGMSFAYWNTARKVNRGYRGDIFAIDLYAGAGGFSAGMSKNSIHTKMGVEKNEFAIKAFVANHHNNLCDGTDKALDEFMSACRDNVDSLSFHLKVKGNTGVPFHGTVKEFLMICQRDPKFKESLGEIHYVHLSPPCNGFSAENRNGGENDELNNSESLTIIEVAKFIRPLAISFENVLGMWRNKTKKFVDQYLSKIYLGLLENGYQFRQFCAKACDYGDAQKRPRLIILASLSHIPLPKIPPATHGPPDVVANSTDCLLEPYVAASDVLSEFEGKFPVQGGDNVGDDKYYLKTNEPSPALRASKYPRHYKENRFLTWKEAHALSFHPDFVVEGSDAVERRRQIGNAVPIGLATAISREVRFVLTYKYDDPSKDEQTGSKNGR